MNDWHLFNFVTDTTAQILMLNLLFALSVNIVKSSQDPVQCSTSKVKLLPLALMPQHGTGTYQFFRRDLLQTHAVGGQWSQWIPVTLNALVQLLQPAPPLPPTSLEHTKQYHVDLMATQAATPLLKDL